MSCDSMYCSNLITLYFFYVIAKLRSSFLSEGFNDFYVLKIAGFCFGFLAKEPPVHRGGGSVAVAGGDR